MPLAEPRPGEPIEFAVYPNASREFTIGSPETITWSSIQHLCSRSAAEWYAWKAHGISNKKIRSAVAGNVRLYIQQASEFYHVAANAKANAAPLIYYYSFLNLAKALCEMRYPRLHRRSECYAHGLSWRPNPLTLATIPKEKVAIRGRGMWHLLWECMMRTAYPVPAPISLPVMKLFSYCPEISVEFMNIFGGPLPMVDLRDLNAYYNARAGEVWLRFSVRRDELKSLSLSAPVLIKQMGTARSGFNEVKSQAKETRAFESTTPAKLKRNQMLHLALADDIIGLNLISHFGAEGKMQYSFPLQNRLPLRLPQLIVSYTILFWLGSLVRYDPHSVSELMDSPYWVLIDGFMTQSRLWLLEFDCESNGELFAKR